MTATRAATAKPPIRNTRRNRGTLLVLLTGASNIGLATVWMLARGSTVTMARLERAGWIAGEWETPEPDDRRRFYRLTPYGREQAMAMLGLKDAEAGQ